MFWAAILKFVKMQTFLQILKTLNLGPKIPRMEFQNDVFVFESSALDFV